MPIQSFKSTCNFYDTIHFRHGFARAGVFTRQEAEILSQCGFVIKQLESGQMAPQDEHHESMLNFLKGVSDPANEVEKAWAKYLRAINTQIKRISGFSSPLCDVDYVYNDGDDA